MAADQDHIIFELEGRHASEAVCQMFRGFSDFIQADAHANLRHVASRARIDLDANPPTDVGVGVRS